MGRKLKTAALLAALGIIALGLAVRHQKQLTRALFVKRLCGDLAPDEAVAAARALRELDPTEREAEALPPAARLRYLLANGFALSDLAPAAFAAQPDSTKDAETVTRATAEETRRRRLVAEHTRSHEPVALRCLAEAKDPRVRERAAQALGLSGTRLALPALRARLVDPAPPVRVAAFSAGVAVLSRLNDPGARAEFLSAAVRAPSLAARALSAATASGSLGDAPVFIAYLELPDTPDADRQVVGDQLRKTLSADLAATAPAGLDGPAWRAWWEKHGAK
jgi:hypothetical protein